MHWTEADDKEVAALDPLKADAMMKRIGGLNSQQDIHALTQLLRQFCASARVSSRTFHETCAIIRDMGILLGSLRRHGIEPSTQVPEVTEILLAAGAATELPPRDALYHYTLWNPEGERLRTYTDHPQEPHLIASIRQAYPGMREATRQVVRLLDYPFHHKRSYRAALLIARDLKTFVFGLNYAIRHVKPKAFIESFRPFFEPILVAGVRYRGPGAVNIPLHIFDYVVWGSSEPDERYQKFTLDYLPYNATEFREYYLRRRNMDSLLDLLERSCRNRARRRKHRPIIRSIETWFRRLNGFRSAHLKYAQETYQGEVPHNFISGSGGHTTSDLEHMKMLTETHTARVHKLLSL